VLDGYIQLYGIAHVLGHGAGIEAVALAKNSIGFGQKVTPCFSQDGGAGTAVKKLYAKAVFQHGNMGTHHGLGTPKGTGRRRKRAFFRRRNKGAELFYGPVHGVKLLLLSIIFLMVSDFL
jgi:hypothetical protein